MKERGREREREKDADVDADALVVSSFVPSIAFDAPI